MRDNVHDVSSLLDIFVSLEDIYEPYGHHSMFFLFYILSLIASTNVHPVLLCHFAID